MKQKNILIGHTGFVGSNILAQHHFDVCFNSKNIDQLSGSADLVVCAGIPSAMWVANQHPQKDLANIENLMTALKRVSVKKIIFISTISVYAQPAIDVNEDSAVFEEKMPYGMHRLWAEQEVMRCFDNYLIIRLPALFGEGLKKNFIYDLMNLAPKFMNQEFFENIIKHLSLDQKSLLYQCYQFSEEGYYLNQSLNILLYRKLVKLLVSIQQTSLNFTHYQSQFQFYHLDHLWKTIEVAMKNNIHLLNLATEPIMAKEVVEYCFNRSFTHKTKKPPLIYDIKTKHAIFYGKKSDYIFDKKEVLQQLSTFLNRENGNV